MSFYVIMPDTLSEICAAKREHVANCKREISEQSLLAEAKHADAPRGFINALRSKESASQFGLIAEIKKASPSKGIIREDFSPGKLAEAYAKGGAACLSVLTDMPYFQGADKYLKEAHSACALPALRKDFMLEPYQIIEARVLGADCILLIMAALENAQAEELMACATSLNLDVLVEVHDEYELERAMERLEPPMLGINNRNLKTFETSLETSKRLSRYLPESILKVSESGISTLDDLKDLREYGINTFLVGESLMRIADVEAATKQLLGL